MSCPALVRRQPAPDFAAVVRHLLEDDAPAAQLIRFAGAGALATSLQVVLFAGLAPVGVLAAHVVSWAASTALANELHRRRTFRAEARVGPVAAQVEGGGLALLGLLLTTAALAGFTLAAPEAGVGAQTLVVLALTGAVGLLRFVVLRWSFGARRARAA